MILRVVKSRRQRWFNSSDLMRSTGSSCKILVGKFAGKGVSCKTYGGVTLTWFPDHSVWDLWVDKVALVQVFLQVLWFSHVSISGVDDRSNVPNHSVIGDTL